MNRILLGASLGLFLLTPLEGCTQNHNPANGEHENHSPYIELQSREIKALPDEDIEQLLRGEGMGMALPAELHDYPGPRHVLDLSTELGLTSSQRQETERIYTEMHDQAVELGRQIVDLERELDSEFAGGSITEASLSQLVGEIGTRRAELRKVHLEAHLELDSVLTDNQRALYHRLRGYNSGHH